MLNLTRLRKKPRLFLRLTGLSVEQFDQLLSVFVPAYQAALARQQERPDRKRRPGAGRPSALTVEAKLLMALLYLRLYVTQTLLSLLFDLDESNISRELTGRLLPLLLETLPTPFSDAPLRSQSEPSFSSGKKKRINSLEELLAEHPEIKEVLVDTTEQPVPQPEDKQRRKERYSGKKKAHTVKTQLVATRNLLLHVFGSLPGCLSDQTTLLASGAWRPLPKGTTVRADRGYQGMDKRFPQLNVVLPVQRRAATQRTALGRAYNFALSQLRIYIEHHFARLKTFACLKQTFRARFDKHEAYVRVVGGLINYKATGKFVLE